MGIYQNEFFFSRDNAAASGGRASRQSLEPHALTAANLIDAIITHQINQSNDGSGHPPNAAPIHNQPHVQQRAGDKLFQVSFPYCYLNFLGYRNYLLNCFRNIDVFCSNRVCVVVMFVIYLGVPRS